MNPARIELALVLDHLGVPAELATFSNRLQLQKKTYLAQVAGTDLGYRFGWYIRGPYSPGLTQEAFSLKDELESGEMEHEFYGLDPSVGKRLDRAKSLWEFPTRFPGTNDDWLELLASLHYLRHIAYRPHGARREFEEAFKLLAESKPQFRNRKEEARAAWKRLNEFGLITNKTLT